MTGFALIALLLIVIALLWLLPPLLRRGHNSADIRAGASNLAILRDQLLDLERDLGSGMLSPEQYQQARVDLERRVLEESGDATSPVAGHSTRGGRRTALVLMVAIPLCAVLLYLRLGSPAAVLLQTTADGRGGITPQQVEAMVEGLAARLQKAPDDGEGWALLARSYFVLQRFQESATAYARAVALLKDDADILADYADALAMSQGRNIDAKVMAIVEQALKVDPTQLKALAMAGSAAFERKNYKQAIGYWEKLQLRAEPNSEFARTVAANIDEARKLGNIKGATAKPVPAASAAQASVRGRVSLSPSLASKANPTDTVFVYARAAQGPRMPLAIVRRQVKDLPFAFTLDDSQAMAPNAKLSNYPEVVINARISKSANAVPQTGDLQGNSKTVKVGAANVTVVIDSVVP